MTRASAAPKVSAGEAGSFAVQSLKVGFKLDRAFGDDCNTHAPSRTIEAGQSQRAHELFLRVPCESTYEGFLQ
jgi:hypothetical protein